MTKTIIVQDLSDIPRTIKQIEEIRKRVQRAANRTMGKWGKTLERDMKRSARLAMDTYRGTLQSTGIQYRQKPNGRIGRLFIRKYGIQLDSMNTHGVNITRRRTRLLAWAKQANSPAIRKKAMKVTNKKIKKFAIVVKKHPFIDAGWGRARPKLTSMLRLSVRKAVNEI